MSDTNCGVGMYYDSPEDKEIERLQAKIRAIEQRHKEEVERLQEEKNKFFWELGQISMTIENTGKIEGTGWSEAHKAVSKLIDHTDMMCDEFQRIKAAVLSPPPESALGKAVTDEVVGLCERGVKYIRQHVPVIEQRDRAEAERDSLRTEVSKLRKQLAEG